MNYFECAELYNIRCFSRMSEKQVVTTHQSGPRGPHVLDTFYDFDFNET